MLAARLALGLGQGLALYAISEAVKAAGEARTPVLDALSLIAGFVPLIVIVGLNTLRPRTLAIWTGAATLVVIAATAHGHHAHPPVPRFWDWAPVMCLGVAAILFIAHHLIAGGDAARRWIAPYADYFEITWRNGVRVALSVAFVGAMWLILYLGAALFGLIGVKAIGEMIRKAWFFFPASTAFFAFAVHLTDVRPALVQGIRMMALTLLSWLSPLMVALAAGFILTLPFTGLAPLWETGKAGAILLGAAGGLVILINAAYQDGDEAPAAVLRWSGRIGALLLAPLVALAAYGMALRIGQYGLSPDRVRAVAACVVATCYAGGYAKAAVSKGVWLKGVERTNIFTAVGVVVILAALLSPIADPARLTAANQLSRLEHGAVSAAEFDYQALRFDAGRYGVDALEDLKAGRRGPKDAMVKQGATAALIRKNRFDTPPPSDKQWRTRIAVYPAGAALPESFLSQDWSAQTPENPTDDPRWMCDQREAPCAFRLLDVDNDRIDEILRVSGGQQTLYRVVDGRWIVDGQLLTSCRTDVEALKEGRFTLKPAPAPLPEVVLDGRVLTFQRPVAPCSSEAAVIKPR